MIVGRTKEEREERAIKILRKMLENNSKILSMIEDILETPTDANKTKLDLLVEQIEERGNK